MYSNPRYVVVLIVTGELLSLQDEESDTWVPVGRPVEKYGKNGIYVKKKGHTT